MDDLVRSFAKNELDENFDLENQGQILPDSLLRAKAVKSKPIGHSSKTTKNPVRSCPSSSGYGKVTTQRLFVAPTTKQNKKTGQKRPKSTYLNFPWQQKPEIQKLNLVKQNPINPEKNFKSFEIFNEKLFLTSPELVEIKPLTDSEREVFKSTTIFGNDANPLDSMLSYKHSVDFSVNFFSNRFLIFVNFGKISVFDLYHIKSANAVKPIQVYDGASFSKFQNGKNLGNFLLSRQLNQDKFTLTATDSNNLVLFENLPTNLHSMSLKPKFIVGLTVD